MGGELLVLSIGIGLILSLVFTEMFGMAAGGMVVPGYIALNLWNPVDCLLTILAGFVTFVIVHSLSSILIIYGRRRTVMMILVGYLIGMIVRSVTHTITAPLGTDYDVIGFIIPGLIAIWLDRQGVVETVSALVTASVAVRLILILAVGMDVRAV
ncbi:poly-gamma-glutamate biosynthesis protein PgsC [bacterium]|nr:poly-gamma-glutamate biosynthesis protein PgsC [bacterium]